MGKKSKSKLQLGVSSLPTFGIFNKSVSNEEKPKKKDTKEKKQIEERSDQELTYILREEFREMEEALLNNNAQYFILENYIPSLAYDKNADEKLGLLSSHIESLFEDIKSQKEGTLTKQTTLEFKLYIDSDEIYEMSAGHFVLHLILWNPLFRLGIMPDPEKDILEPKTFNNHIYKDYMDSIIDRYKHLTEIKTLSSYFAETFDYIREILLDMELEGFSFSIYDMIMAAKRNDEIRAILNTEIDLKNHKFSDTEDYLKNQTDKLLQLFLEDPEDNCMKPMILAGEGINRKQVREFAVHLGMKPNLDGKTIPLTSNTNLLRGLRTTEAVYVDGKGARKAVLLQKKVGDSGYLQRMFTKSTSSIQLHPDEDYDCGTKNFLVIEISDKEEDKKTAKKLLKQLRGSVIRIDSKKSKEEFVVSGDSDYKELKGHTIYVRTPATCASKADKICKKCYGERYYMNKDIHIGLNAALNILRNMTQKSLSAKHILNTLSTIIKFNDTFKKIFKLNDGYIINFKKKIVVEDVRLLVPSAGVFDIDDIEEAFNESFDHVIVEYEGEKFKIEEESGVPFYLSEELYRIYLSYRRIQNDDVKYIKISGKQLVDLDSIMMVQLINDEITKPLRKLRSMIEKGSVLEDMSYQELIFKFNQYLLEAGIFSNINDIAILLRKLIKSPGTNETPDWSQKEPEYYLTSVNNSVRNGTSVIDGLTFEYFKRQLRDPMTFQKTGTSIYDSFFINYDELDMRPYIEAMERDKG